jgi:hypothetical protein
VDLLHQYGAIQRGEQCLRYLYYGFDEVHQYLRLDLDRQALLKLTDWVLTLTLAHGWEVRITPAGPPPEDPTGILPVTVSSPAAGRLPAVACVLGQILEVAVPMAVIQLAAGEKLHVAVALLRQGGEVLERHPDHGTFLLNASVADLEAQAWPV